MIKITKVEIYEIFIPFRFKYGHSLKMHRGVSSIICKVFGDSGAVGYGESVPREYVTGENCASVMGGIKKISQVFLQREITLFQFKKEFLEMGQGEYICFPSCSFCAFEGAVLDLFGRILGKPVAHLFFDGGKNPLTYSGSIGMGNRSSIKAKALVYNGMGFRHHKIKVGNESDQDRIRLIKKYFHSDCTFFADANCAWDREEAIKHIIDLHKMGIEAIEEPLKPKGGTSLCQGQINRESTLSSHHYEDYRWLKKRSPIPIIADESLISPKSMGKIIDSESFDILNIRLSKCGGIILGSEMVNKAIQNNLEYAFGAMVGETPILANLGSHFGYINSGHNYIQGHSHKALHTDHFTEGGSDLKRGGKVHLNLLLPGTGVIIDDKKLLKLTKTKEEVL